jgi:hypothetical protein
VNDEVGVSGVVVLVPQEGSFYGSELSVKSCLLVSQGSLGPRRRLDVAVLRSIGRGVVWRVAICYVRLHEEMLDEW